MPASSTAIRLAESEQRVDRRNRVISRAVQCVRTEAEGLTRVCLSLAVDMPGVAFATQLHHAYGAVLAEPIPDDQYDLLRRLD